MIPPIQASRFEELEPLLAEELSKIRNTPGKVSDFTKPEAMQKLSNSIIPSVSQKLADLQGAVDAAEQNYQQIRLRQKICSNSFEAAVQKFHTELDTALRSYAYLNEGYGQFEEYEWSDQAEDEETDEYLQGVDFDPNQLIAPPSFLGSLCQKLAAYKTFVANTVASLHQLQCWEYMQERQLAQALITCTEAFAEALVPLREVTGMEYDDYSREEELYDASTSSEIVLYDGPKARADINEDLNALCNFGCSLISSEEESDDPLTVRADINDDLNALCNFECSLINLIDWARGFAYTVHGRATLSLRYGQKVVVEAQKFCNGTPPEVLQESYGQYLRTLQTFFNEIESGSPSDEWLDTIDMELRAQDNSLHSALENGLEAIHTRLDFLTPERPDDPNDELALRALDKEKTMFEDLLGQMKDMYQAYSSVRGSWLHRDQLAAEREKARQLIESSRRGLVKNLGKIKPNKSLQNTTSNLYRAAVTSDIPGIFEEVTRIIRLLRKKTLENADKESSLQMLYQRKEVQEVSLEKLEGRPPDDFVDPYIELTRIINRITLVEKEHLQKQLQLAEQFFPNVGNYTPPPGKEAAFAQYQTGPNTPLVTVGVELSPNTPMDSALVEVTRALSQRGVVLGNYRGFLRLSGRKVSLFERGVFGSAITKSMDRNVCPQSVYEEVALGREAPASSVQSSPVPSPNPPPAYYTAFNLSGLTPFPANTVPCGPEQQTLYTLLAIRLAFHFRNGNGRRLLGVPPGSPVVCIMTSKEGQVLSWGLNTKMSNPTDLTRHAEVNAIAAYFCNHPNAKELPAGVQFFTSLKPCRMCAGAIADATASAFDRLQVVYGQNDPTQSSTCINTQERELVHLFSETLNKNYGSIKHDIHTLCAADSLDHPIMGNLAHRAIEAFDDARRAATSASLPIIEHLKKFYKICTGESLLDSH